MTINSYIGIRYMPTTPAKGNKAIITTGHYEKDGLCRVFQAHDKG
jgi:hypothetical protein